MSKFFKKMTTLALAAALFVSVPGAKAFAALKKTTTSDNFDNTEYVGKVDPATWTTSASSIKTEEVIPSTKALKIGYGSNEVQAALISKNELKDLKEVSFNIKYCTPGWFNIAFRKTKDALLTDNGEINPYVRPKGGIFTRDEWQHVKIVVTSATTFDIYVADYGKDFGDPAESFALTADESFESCYFDFELNTSDCSDYLPCAYLDNVKFTLGDGTVLEDTFEDGTMANLESYGATVTKDGSTNTYTPDHNIELVDGASKLAFDKSKKGDFIMLAKEIEKNDKFLKPSNAVLDVTFDAKFGEDAADTDSLSYFFAMESAAGSPLNSTWCYTLTKDGGEVVYYNASGEKEELEGHLNNFTSLTADKGSTIRLKLTLGGELTVYENGESVLTYTGVDAYSGFTGFSVTGDNVSKIYVDNVSINEYAFEKVVTKSVSHNFNNNYFGPEGKEDLVYRADSGTIEVIDNELSFERCSDGSYFGSAYKYDTFTAEFKMTSIYGGWQPGDATDGCMAANRWIGLDFGRKSAKVTSYGSYATLGIRVTHPTVDNNDSKKLITNWKKCENFLYKSGVSELENYVYTKVADIPATLFKDITYDKVNTQRSDISADDAVCFRLVAEDNRVSLYMKKASEGEYTLYVTVDNVDPSGYFAIVCTGYAYCTFDDFVVTNTADIYDLADTEKPASGEGSGSGEVKTEVIYDRANVDVNWQEELNLNGGSSKSGCGSSVGGSMTGIAALLGLLVAFKKKKKD